MPDEKITEDGREPLDKYIPDPSEPPEEPLPFENEILDNVVDDITDPLVFIHDVYRYLFLKPMELLDDKPKGRIEQARHEGKLEILRDLRQIHKKHFGGK